MDQQQALEMTQGSVQSGRQALEMNQGPVQGERQALEINQGPVQGGRQALEMNQGRVQGRRQALEMNQGRVQGRRKTKGRLVMDVEEEKSAKFSCCKIKDGDTEEGEDSRKMITCCKRKRTVKRYYRRRARGEGVKRSRRSTLRRSRSRSRKKRSKSRKGRSRRSRRSRRRSKRSRKTGKRGRSRRSRRGSSRSKRRRGRSRKSRSRRRRRRSRKSRSRRRRKRSKAEIIADNRAQLTKSQSLTAPGAKTLPDAKDAAIANLEAPVTPYSPMRKDKRTRPSQDGAILKAATQPALERDVRFEPMRSPDERPKKQDEAPSTAIDIDSSIKRRRPKPSGYQAATDAAVRREQEMRQREEERFMRPPLEKPAVEPAFQHVPDMVPIEEGIDPEYPAQRIVISNFVRNGCHIKRWLYEDSYPLDATRPSIYGLTGKSRQYPNCCCGRRDLCYGCAGRGSTSKQRRYIQDNYEKDLIRGELQRLDVILKNLDD